MIRTGVLRIFSVHEICVARKLAILQLFCYIFMMFILWQLCVELAVVFAFVGSATTSLMFWEQSCEVQPDAILLDCFF